MPANQQVLGVLNEVFIHLKRCHIESLTCFVLNRGSQGYRRHIGEGVNSLGRARGQSNFPYNFLQKLRNIPVDVLLIFSLNIKDFVFWSFLLILR